MSFKKHLLFYFYLFTLLMCFTLILPLQNFINDSSTFDQRRIIEFVFIVTSCLFILFSKKNLSGTLETFFSFRLWIRLSLSIVSVLAIISAFINAQSTSTALMDLSLFSLLFIITLTLADYFRQNKDSYIYLIYTFYLCIIAYSIQLFANYFFILLDTSTSADIKTMLISNLHFNFLFENPRFLDSTLSSMWCLSLIPLLTVSSKRLRALAIICTTLIFYIIIIHKSRTISLEILVISILSLAIYRKKAVRFIAYTFLCFGLAFALFELITLITYIDTGSIIDRVSDGNSDRAILWWLSFDIGLANPILGVGMLNIPFYFDYQITSVAYPHSLLFALIAENGFITATLVFAIIVYSTITLFRKNIKPYNPITMVFLMALVCILIDTMFASSFIQPQTQLFYISILAFCISIKKQNYDIKPHILTQSVKAFNINVIRMIILICLIIFITVFIYQLHFILSNPSIAYDPKIGRQAPSFWVFGWLQTAL